jgi:hypothetical protein
MQAFTNQMRESLRQNMPVLSKAVNAGTEGLLPALGETSISGTGVLREDGRVGEEEEDWISVLKKFGEEGEDEEKDV